MAETRVPGDGGSESEPGPAFTQAAHTRTTTADLDAGGEPARRIVASGDDRSGEQLGHFKLLSKLGEGGMGVVYAAEDSRLGRTVALKILPLAAVASPEKRRRFLREARAASAVMHPGIAAVFEVGEDRGEVFLAMERVEGRTLRAVLRERGGPLPVERAVTVARDLARALEHAHRAGVVHRDLKPENVMETRDGAVKILDFGLAKRVGPEAVEAGDVVTVEGKIWGTPGYMAPEQTRGSEVDARTDIFALGVLLFELLTNERPFGGETAMAKLIAIDRDPARVPSSIRAEVPASMDAIVARCLEKRPADRFATCGELAAALDEALAGLRATEARRSVPAAEVRSGELAARPSGEVQAPEGKAAGLSVRPSDGSAPRWGALVAVVALGAAAVAVWRARSVAPSGGAQGSATLSAAASAPAASASSPATQTALPPPSGPEPVATAVPRRPCLEGDPGRGRCAGTGATIAWCNPDGALVACCGSGLVPKGADGICGCAPGGTNVAEARARGCAAVPGDAAARYQEAKVKALDAAAQCFIPGARDRWAGGTFAAEFYLTPEGDVFGARVERCTVPDEAAQRCALEALRSTRFPPPPAEEAGKKKGFGFMLEGEVSPPR